MKFMHFKLLHPLTIIMLVLSFANTTFADRNAGRVPGPTRIAPELKHALAEMYQKMADCLRTDKAFETCRQEACTCQVLNATGHCPIDE
jgi:hypothetical protein